MKKFKAWLIHKLGGIVVADLPKPMPIKKKEVHIIDIHASGIFTGCRTNSEVERENLERYKARRLADGLAQQILEQGLATITSKPIRREFSPDEYEVTATAYLIRESDAKIENCDAVLVRNVVSADALLQKYGTTFNVDPCNPGIIISRFDKSLTGITSGEYHE